MAILKTDISNILSSVKEIIKINNKAFKTFILDITTRDDFKD